MTIYRIDAGNGRILIATWRDLPTETSESIGPFAEAQMATVAKSVLNAASRYRWHRLLQLWSEGIFTEEGAGPDPVVSFPQPTMAQLAPDSGWTSDQPASLPRLPTGVILGDSPMSEYLKERIEGLLPDPGEEPEPADPDSLDFADRLPLGNLRPLLWRDWCSHLQADEHDRLATELDADDAATTGSLVGRARQIAWYLSAELLVDEDDPRLTPNDEDDDEERTRAFQKSLVQLFSDLIGLRVESTAVDWDPYSEGLLRVHSPKAVVGFWLDQENWYYGSPDPEYPDTQPTRWRHAGTLPTDTSIGNLASFIRERIAHGTWPFGGHAPDEGRGFRGLRRGPR